MKNQAEFNALNIFMDWPDALYGMAGKFLKERM